MTAPLGLVLLCIASLAGAIAVQGSVLDLWSGGSVLALTAAVMLALRQAFRPRRQQEEARPAAGRPRPVSRSIERDERPKVLVDGSNVMHWDGDAAQLATLRAVIAALKAKGERPGVIFDASAGHKLAGRYLHHNDLAQMLHLAESDVFVVPKGHSADEFLLDAARSMRARIVTNDQFRDWADRFPELRQPGQLIPGQIVAGRVQFGSDGVRRRRRK